MIVIRARQRQVFVDAAVADFVRRAVALLYEHFPIHCGILGRAAVAAIVREGVGRAAAHDIVVERDVSRYVGLMFVLGSGFDADPLFPWARAILIDPRMAPPAKVERLHERTLEFMRRAVGPRSEHVWRALARIRAYGFAAAPLGDARSAEALCEQLYPERAAAAGRDALASLAAHGRASTSRLRLGDGCVELVTFLMFALGSGFAEDLQFPWAAQALANADGGEEMRRARLHSAAMTYVETLLDAVEREGGR